IPTDITTALLTTVPTAFHAGVDDVLLTGLATAVTEWRGDSRTSSVLVNVEGHGRTSADDDMDLSRTVGWFTNSYPVRLDAGSVDVAEVRAGGPAAGRAVKRIKELLRAVPGDGLGYGLLRYLNPDTAPQLANLPTPQIGFNYLGRFTTDGTGQTAAQDWTPTGAVATGGPGESLPVMHALEAMGMVHDLPDGPQLTLSLACAEG
ncbi:condensation domain-containing protein, partial [Plantactinospora solaniradicis]